jgi:predicted neuraminidase
MSFRVAALWAWLLCLGLPLVRAGEPVSEVVFVPEKKHNHASCLVEQPDGSWFVAWFRGSGERQSDDVGILGSRRRRKGGAWEKPFVVSDTEGFPDCNPSLAVAPDGRLWLFHPTILANTWESALLRVKVTRDWRRGAPRWERNDVVVLRPGAEFDAAMSAHLPKLQDLLHRSDLKADERKEAAEFLEAAQGHITNRLYRRLGWMPRAHPLFASDRWFLPLYHDGFSVSLVALSDDRGATWRASAPIVGAGNVQPSLTPRRDGSVVAWMRDNGPPPKRLLVSESKDRGETWTPAADSEIPNPGSGAEVVVLRDGTWLFIGNDTEEGRHSLAVWMSGDEGRTWRWRRNVARAEEGKGSFGYPSVVEARDGGIHATWSESSGGLETIRHTRFDREWLRR